jgi:acetylglutamate/LysW-gamma-L-alpha-aminoadipate kinase
VDGDRAAAAVAAALHAEELAIMTNVPGLLRDPQDHSSLISSIPAVQLDEYMSYARGRMRKKLLGAQEALSGGVQRVYIGSASVQTVLDGNGTTIEATPVSTYGGPGVQPLAGFGVFPKFSSFNLVGIARGGNA